MVMVSEEDTDGDAVSSLDCEAPVRLTEGDPESVASLVSDKENVSVGVPRDRVWLKLKEISSVGEGDFVAE